MDKAVRLNERGKLQGVDLEIFDFKRGGTKRKHVIASEDHNSPDSTPVTIEPRCADTISTPTDSGADKLLRDFKKRQKSVKNLTKPEVMHSHKTIFSICLDKVEEFKSIQFCPIQNHMDAGKKDSLVRLLENNQFKEFFVSEA